MPQVIFLVSPPLGTSFYSSFPRHRKDKRPIPNNFLKNIVLTISGSDLEDGDHDVDDDDGADGGPEEAGLPGVGADGRGGAGEEQAQHDHHLRHHQSGHRRKPTIIRLHE